MLNLPEAAMNSQTVLGGHWKDAAMWSKRHCLVDPVGMKGFVEAAITFELCYCPLLFAVIHAIFGIVVVAQYGRSRLWPPKKSAQNELGKMHRKAKFLCVGLLLLEIVRGWTQLSIPGLVLHASQAVAWLTISIALQREEAQDRAIFFNILKAWWVTFLGASVIALSATVFTGSIVVAVLDSVPFISSMFLVIISFTGYVYSSRVGEIAKLDSVKTPLLNESLATDTALEASPSGSGYTCAGVASVFTFSWLNPLLSTGSEKPLIIGDVPLIDPADDPTRNCAAFQEIWELEKFDIPPGACPSMSRVLFKTFWRPFVTSFLFALVWTCAMFVGPILQNRLIKFMEEEHRKFAPGFTLVLILLTGKFVETLSSHQLIFKSRKLGLRMWAGVGCAVYKKSLRLSLKARQVRSVGEITNLVSSDVQRLLELAYYIQQALAIPVQLVIAVIILFQVVGVAMVAGLSILVMVLLLNVYVIRKMREYRALVLAGKDRRMRATAECLGNMKVIKLQAWDEMFRQRIAVLRKEERSWIEKFMYAWARVIHLVWTGPLLVSGFTFLTMLLIGEPLTTARVFTAITTFRILQEPIRFIPEIISNIIQSMVSLRRMASFLMEDEVDESAVERTSNSDDCCYALEMEGAAFTWDKLAAEPALKDLNLKIKKGTCVAICGGVGSGKSSLLYCIAGELPKLSGTAKLSGRVAYVAQSAWVQNNSIRENILFGRAMDPKRYKEAVRVSGLEADLAQFPDGDDTEIGERGTTLSGGQKQRVQLARSVYQDADVYLLDDPFSAVDAHTGTFLFEECVRGALRDKTVILVTHQVEFLPAVDQIVVMRSPGQIVQKGTYSKLVEEGKDFGAFVGALEESLQNVIRASHSRLEEEPEMLNLLNPESDTGDSSMKLDSGDGELVSAQLGKLESRAGSLRKSASSKASEIAGTSKSTKRKLIEEEIREKGRVDSKVIWAYITKVRYGVLWFLILIPQTTTIVCQLCSDLWLASGTSNGKSSSARFMAIYFSLLIGCSLSVFIRTRLVAYSGIITAQGFFIGMLNCIIRAPMSFIDSTPVGRILSRSSTDQTALDLELPTSFASIGNNLISLTGSLTVTTYVTPPVLLLTIPLGWLFVRLQRFYIASARELSRLTALMEAPMFLHISESISGATTIRAFQEQSRFTDTNAQRLDTYQRSYFHNLTATEWLGLRLDSLGATVLSFAAVLLITLPEDKIAPGLAGLSLSYGLSLSGVLMRLVTSASRAENKMISVERIRQYSEIPSEAPAVIPGRRPPLGWPNVGRVELQNLQIRYRPSYPLVLKGLSCVIHPREKVGVVGRTGSGKSTLIQALFRLIEPAGGSILIDGLDITTIGLNDLRSALGVIPQEPTLFEGSVRSNFDPFNLYSDQQIWESLDKCQLGQVVRDKPEKLSASVSEQGENWSVGQRQLLCLGRALLRHARILVLDEATASVDISTDAVIQCTIKQHFADCTVISVAHRIPTVIDSNRVLVLDNGYLMENDSPEHLLANENSMFSKLVQEYRHRRATESSSSLDSMD